LPLPSSAGRGIEFLRDGGTYVEMGNSPMPIHRHQLAPHLHQDINCSALAFTGNDLPLGVDMLYRSRAKRPVLRHADALPVR
jgi:hypothetical protein